MRIYISRLTKAAIIGVVACCLMTACTTTTSESGIRTEADSIRQALSCPEGQVNQGYLAVRLQPVPDDFGYINPHWPNRGLYYGGGVLPDDDKTCLNKEQAGQYVSEQLPILYKKVNEANNALDAGKAEADRLIKVIGDKPDVVTRLFGIIRNACEVTQAPSYGPYRRTYVMNAAEATIDKMIGDYQQFAQRTLQDPYAYDSIGMVPSEEAPFVGRVGEVESFHKRLRDIYLETWGDAYELFHTDATYRHLRAGDFPSRDFDKVFEQEC